MLAALALSMALGAAARPAVTLEVRRGPGAESCPSAEEVDSLLVTRLGYSPVQAGAADRVVVEFRVEGAGLAARLELARAGQPPRARELRDPDRSCGPLAAATAFAIAIAVDPQHLRAPPEEPPAPPAPVPVEEPAAAPAPKPQPAPAPPPPAPAGPPVGWELGVAGAGVAGGAPNLTAAFLLHGGLSIDVFRLGLELRVDLPSTRSAGTGTVTSYLVLGNLLPCVAFGRFAACAVVSAGALRAGSMGLTGSANVSAPMVLLGGRVSVTFRPMRWLQLTPWLDVLGALTRVTLSVDGTPVWVTPALAGLLGLRFSVASP